MVDPGGVESIGGEATGEGGSGPSFFPLSASSGDSSLHSGRLEGTAGRKTRGVVACKKENR